jgi:hypothetical protein
MCKKCAKPMAGAANNHKPYYACNRRDDSQVAQCTRRIDALKLEAFATDAAVELLTRLDVSGAPIATLALSEADEATISADEAELAELKDMWDHRETLHPGVPPDAQGHRRSHRYPCGARPWCAYSRSLRRSGRAERAGILGSVGRQ